MRALRLCMRVRVHGQSPERRRTMPLLVKKAANVHDDNNNQAGQRPMLHVSLSGVEGVEALVGSQA